jgi:hypothetical protein
MKMLTIQQPWASLIAMGKKRTEFRSWRTHYRGDLYIHAGKGIDREECKRAGLDPDTLPRGQVIAVAELYDVEKLREGYGWKLKNVKKTRRIAAKGKLGLWNWTRR